MVCLMIFVFALIWCSWEPLNVIARTGTRHRRIAGGMPTTLDHYPYIVSLQADTGEIYCAGTILSEKIVLTAAHCTSIFPSHSICVLIGEPYQQNHPHVCHNVSEVYPHEMYELPNHLSDAINDIALITLETPFTLSGNVQKVNLTKHGYKVEVGSSATAIGWGAVMEPGVEKPLSDDKLEVNFFQFDNGTFVAARVFPTDLQQVNLTIISRSECIKKYRDPVHVGQICSYSAGKGGCVKDSGGPLIVNGTQVGIFSGSKGCGGNPGYPGLYTNVAFYREWIDQRMEDINRRLNAVPISQ